MSGRANLWPNPGNRIFYVPYSFQMLKQAVQYFADKDVPESLEKADYIYGLAQDLAPSKASFVWNHARILRRLKQYDEALNVINIRLEQYGGNDLDTTITRACRASVYLEMGAPAKALTSLDEDIESYQAGVMMNVAEAYEALGQIGKAAEQYQKALTRHPTVAHVLAGAAGFFWGQGEPELAARVIGQGCSIRSDEHR